MEERPVPVTEQADKDPDLTWLEEDRLHEECGVFGIFNHPDAAALTALGLHALQHRGQEAAGIVSFDGEHFHTERRRGLVNDAFSREDVIDPDASARLPKVIFECELCKRPPRAK